MEREGGWRKGFLRVEREEEEAVGKVMAAMGVGLRGLWKDEPPDLGVFGEMGVFKFFYSRSRAGVRN